MKSVTTRIELDGIRSLPRAFIFIYVNWAGQARKSRASFLDFEAAWELRSPLFPVPSFQVDLSDQDDGELWTEMRAWLARENQPVDSLTLGGYGAFPLRLDRRIPSTNGAFYTSLGRKPQENEPHRTEG